MDLSMMGIVVSLGVLIFLALRGWHIIIIVPIAATLVCFFSGMDVLQSLYGPYMNGFISYAKRFYLIFLGAYSLDAMPHNGAVITVLAVFGLTHNRVSALFCDRCRRTYHLSCASHTDWHLPILNTKGGSYANDRH